MILYLRSVKSSDRFLVRNWLMQQGFAYRFLGGVLNGTAYGLEVFDDDEALLCRLAWGQFVDVK